MNLGGLPVQHTTPIMLKVLLEDDSVYRDNALRNEITKAGNCLPVGSFFSISVCSHSPLSWKWISSGQAHLPLERCIEASTSPGVNEGEALLASIDSASAEINGIALRAFRGDPKSVEKWIIFVKNSDNKTTIARTINLSTILKRCLEENCTLIRINSSNPHAITALVDGTNLSPTLCARMEGSSWRWLQEKAIAYVAEMKGRTAATIGVGTAAQVGEEVQTPEAELLAVVKGKTYDS